MRLLETQDTVTPFDGMRRRTAWLRTHGYQGHHTRVARLRHPLGMEAIDTTPQGSQATAGQTLYPYGVRGGKVTRMHHVWSPEIPSRRVH